METSQRNLTREELSGDWSVQLPIDSRFDSEGRSMCMATPDGRGNHAFLRTDVVGVLVCACGARATLVVGDRR